MSFLRCGILIVAEYSLKEALFIASKHTTGRDRRALRLVKEVFDGEIVGDRKTDRLKFDTGQWHEKKTFIVEEES